jgi:succinyl-diaminopimelate desuccinylase
VEGGYKVYSVVVPDRARIEINRLLVPGETFEKAIEDMKELVRSLELNSEVEVNRKPPVYNPFELDENSRIIRVFKDAFEETNGFEPKFGYLKSVTDGNVFSGEGGIPCVHLGPQGGGVHQPDEYVYVDSLKPVTEIYVRTASKFLSTDNVCFETASS